MLLVDVNVLVYAHREDTDDHEPYREWVLEMISSDRAYGMSDLVLSGFLRVVTLPGVFDPPTPMHEALEFVRDVRDQPNCVRVEPGPRQWEIFERLCRTRGVRGNLVPDAYLAAMAIESGSEWVTTDRGFARFPGLRWRHPLES